MNVNPRSCYNKNEELTTLIEQYSAEVICVSESWEQENKPLEDILDLPNFKIVTNVKQREFRGGKPAILVNEDKY